MTICANTPFISDSSFWSYHIYLLEARGWVSDLVDHCPLDGCHGDVGAVGERFLVPVGSPSGLLVTRLIEIWLRHQDERLDGHENL